MKIKEKVYPYPVIKEKDADYQDYKNANFDFDIYVDENTDKLTIKINTENIPNKLIPGNGFNEIKYGYQLESTMNKNRKFYLSDKPELTIELNAADYIGNVEINAYIIANNALTVNFDSDNDNIDDFYDGPVQFPKGGIIAVARPTRAIDVGLDGSMPNNPIRIVKEDGLNGIRYTIDDSQIKIGLDEKNHEIYAKFGKDKQMLEFILNSVVTPAVSKAILELSKGEIGENSNWGENFKIKLLSNGMTLDGIADGTYTVEEATQVILNNPIDRMFKALKEYGENNED